MRALIAGGSDLLLVETIFDSLNAKAALVAIQEVFAEDKRELPVMISAAVGRGGETMISAQTVEAFWNAVEHVKPLSVGLNCSLGPDLMYPFLAELAEKSSAADLLLPERRPAQPAVADGLRSGARRTWRATWASSRAPACSTSPAAAAATRPSTSPPSPARWRTPRRAVVAPASARAPVSVAVPAARPRPRRRARPLRLSGSQPFTQQPGVYLMIGERTNVAGSPKFAKLIKEGKYEEAVSVARQQVENGANVIDICMDEGMIDGVAAMSRFLSLLASEPEVAKVPFMVDSSKWEVIEAGLKCLQGKGIVNSISLKEGEDKFRQNARTVLKYGAAVVVMAFDEAGQAATYEDKIRICERAYRILVDEVGFPPEDIIFDPNILTVATGMEEHNNYARRLHQRHALDQGEPAARQGERRRVQHLVQLPRQQPRPRGDALGVPVPRDPGRHGHGHRQRRHAGGVRGDRARAEGAGRGRAAQPAPRRHRAPGRLRRAAQGRRRRRRRRRQAAERKTRSGARAPSRRACRTRWSRASTRTSTPTPRRRARSWAGRCW